MVSTKETTTAPLAFFATVSADKSMVISYPSIIVGAKVGSGRGKVISFRINVEEKEREGEGRAGGRASKREV